MEEKKISFELDVSGRCFTVQLNPSISLTHIKGGANRSPSIKNWWLHKVYLAELSRVCHLASKANHTNCQTQSLKSSKICIKITQVRNHFRCWFESSKFWNSIFCFVSITLEAIKDDCVFATLTQLATAPLTAYFATQKADQVIGEKFTIHLIGAELQFEADVLDIWETFFMHLAHNLMELTIVFCGPELNAEKYPIGHN